MTECNIVSSLTEPCCALKYYPEIEICVKEQKGEQVSTTEHIVDKQNYYAKVCSYLCPLFPSLLLTPQMDLEARDSRNL